MRFARSQSRRAAQNVLEGVARRGPHCVRAARAQTGLGHRASPPRHPSHASTPFPSPCKVTARLLSPGCRVPGDMVDGSLYPWTASPRYFRASPEEYTGYLSLAELCRGPSRITHVPDHLTHESVWKCKGVDREIHLHRNLPSPWKGGCEVAWWDDRIGLFDINYVAI
jgi:hypothetical protein